MGTQTASSAGSHNVIVQAMGDGVQVQVGLAPLKLIPWQASVKRQPRIDIDILNPAYQAVPLTGREADLEFLLGWLNGDGIAITVLTGRGGAGKTRLALEVLQRLPDGWAGGFLGAEEARRFADQSNLSDWSWQQPTLIVVDYAGLMGQVLARWFGELAEHSGGQHPLRVLLLERHASLDSGWYHDLADDTWHGDGVRAMFSPLEPRLITPLDGMEARRAVLSAGQEALRRLHPEAHLPPLPEPGADGWFDQRLRHEQWSSPLLLLMAAVSSLSGEIHAALNCSRQDLATRVARREAQRIRNGAGDRTKEDLLLRLYACVTMCGGLPHDTAVEVAQLEFDSLKKEYAGGAGQAVDDLARLLGAAETLPSLSPDLLAEAYLLTVLGGSGSAVIQRVARVAPERVAAVLVRTVQDFGQKENQLPLEWMRALLQGGMEDATILLAIDGALPRQSLALRGLALEVSSLLIAGLRKVDPPELTLSLQSYLAGALNKLSNRQSEMGQRAEALASISEAVCHFRVLAEANPDTFLPSLAGVLNNQANFQSGMGQRPEALASIEEAVGLGRALAEANPEVFLPDLAMSLNNQANRQSELDQRPKALASIAEAVGHYCTLTEANPDVFLPYLAGSLNNQANFQNAVGQRDEALASIGKAVDHYRVLADATPDAFRPDLAMSLNNQAKLQSDMGRTVEALALIDEAVDLRRALAEANPDAFLPDLAKSLSVLGDCLAAMQQVQEAVGAAAESLECLRPAFRQFPESFRDLATATVRDYILRSEAAGSALDEALLTPYISLFEKEGEA